MILSELFRQLRHTLKTLRRNRNNVRALSHLDAHLLKDIGLHVEQGVVRPLYPESGLHDPVPEARPEASRRTPQEVALDAAVTLCPRCGAPLT